MGESSIGWLHPPPRGGHASFGTPGQPGYTVNYWIGCSKVDPESMHCSADREAGRGRLPIFRERNAAGLPVWGDSAPRHIVGAATIRQVDKWDREAGEAMSPRWVFGGSQMDWLEDRPELAEPRSRLVAAIERTRNLRWILLTKRPQNFARLVPQWSGGAPTNAWIGISAGTQRSLDSKLEAFAAIPSDRKMISGEPLLEAVDWRHALRVPGMRWIIFGGESGARAKVRPLSLDWIRRGVQQAREAPGIHLYVKQLGSRVFGSPDCRVCGVEDEPECFEITEHEELAKGDTCPACGDTVEVALVYTDSGKPVLRPAPGDGVSHPEGVWQPAPGTGYARVLHLKHHKGEDWREWPPDLQVQEWPDGAAFIREDARAAC